jgi:hypothetical protein
VLAKKESPNNKKISYFCVEDYGDSIVEKLNNVFSKALDKVGFPSKY